MHNSKVIHVLGFLANIFYVDALPLFIYIYIYIFVFLFIPTFLMFRSEDADLNLALQLSQSLSGPMERAAAGGGHVESENDMLQRAIAASLGSAGASAAKGSSRAGRGATAAVSSHDADQELQKALAMSMECKLLVLFSLDFK